MNYIIIILTLLTATVLPSLIFNVTALADIILNNGEKSGLINLQGNSSNGELVMSIDKQKETGSFDGEILSTTSSELYRECLAAEDMIKIELYAEIGLFDDQLENVETDFIDSCENP